MKIAFSETSELQLKHPITGEPLCMQTKNGEPIEDKPMMAVIYGKHTAVYKNARNELMRRLQKEQKKEFTAEDGEERGLDVITACIKEFKNLDIETEHGKLDPSDIRGTLKKAFWIKEQVDSAIVNLENFTDKP